MGYQSLEGRNTIYDYANPKLANKVIKRIEAYFEECDKTNRIYTISGFCLEAKISHNTLLKYRKGEAANWAENLKEAFEIALLKMENQLEENMLTGKGYGTGHIFALKARFGWSDNSNTVINNNNNFDMAKLDDIQLEQLINSLSGN